MRNLDRAPGFWLTVAMLLPFMVALEVLLAVDDFRFRLSQNK